LNILRQKLAFEKTFIVILALFLMLSNYTCKWDDFCEIQAPQAVQERVTSGDEL